MIHVENPQAFYQLILEPLNANIHTLRGLRRDASILGLGIGNGNEDPHP